MKKTLSEYRIGKSGALLDEHERAISEICDITVQVSQKDYERILDYETTDDNCRSMKTICSHVLKSGYNYSNLIRNEIQAQANLEYPKSIHSVSEVASMLNHMFLYMIETVELAMRYATEWWDILVQTNSIGSAGKINSDILLEHSIVHLLIHRRQLEKFQLQLMEGGSN